MISFIFFSVLGIAILWVVMRSINIKNCINFKFNIQQTMIYEQDKENPNNPTVQPEITESTYWDEFKTEFDNIQKMLPLTLPMPESMKQLHKHIQELINSGRQPTLSGATYLAKAYKEHLDSYCDRELKCIIKTHESISQKISNRLCNTPSKSSKTLRNRGKPLTIKNQSIDKASVRVK